MYLRGARCAPWDGALLRPLSSGHPPLQSHACHTCTGLVKPLSCPQRRLRVKFGQEVTPGVVLDEGHSPLPGAAQIGARKIGCSAHAWFPAGAACGRICTIRLFPGENFTGCQGLSPRSGAVNGVSGCAETAPPVNLQHSP